MLNFRQRFVLFYLFVFIVICLLILEIYIVYYAATFGLTGWRVISGILTASILFGCGNIFMKLVRANFLGKELIPTHRLHQLWSDRNSIVASSNGQNRYGTKVDLITETLKFGLDSIGNIVDGSHFEFCVFVDAEMPLLLAYFDSNRNSNARSMKDRREKPYYYRDKGYEVTKLLLNPSTYPVIFEDTSDPATKYVFATENQKKQLLSSILVCIDTHHPCAIVVSSNKKNSFSKIDDRAISFVKLLAEMIKYDLFTDHFIEDIRKNNSTLFPISSNASALQPVT